MRQTVTAFTSILLTLALTGSVVGSLPTSELPEQALPTGGVNGQAIGCELNGSGDFVFGYGEPGVPTSTGIGDGTCDDYQNLNSGDITHTVLKVNGDRHGYTGAYGFDSTTWEFAELTVTCPESATLLVEWETEEVTYLSGADCIITTDGNVDIADLEWLAYGGGYGEVKFVHTDNLVDALVHLLA